MIFMENRNIVIIGVDTGYGNIKTANTVMRTGIRRYDTEPVFQGQILKYEGAYYRVGEGHKDFISDKSGDEDFYLLTLAGVAKELNTRGIAEANVHLAVGLPLTWVRAQRESFRAYLTRNADVCFQFNGKSYNIHFAGCSVFPQGYSALMTFGGNMAGTAMLADIGNGTMNILYLVNRKPREDRCWTEKLGVNQCMIAARNAVMDRFGVKIDESIVEQVLRTGAADVADKYLDCIRAVAVEYTEQIFAALRKYEYNPDLMRLYIVGGGGCLIRNFGEYERDRVTIVEDICATAKGYEIFAHSELRRKEGK